MSVNQEAYITTDDEGYLVRLNKGFYEQAAVFSAAYKFMGGNIIKIFPVEDTMVGIHFKPKECGSIEKTKQDVNSFLNEAIDQQVRLYLEREFGHMRDVIVEHAFSQVKKKVDPLKQSLNILPFSFKRLSDSQMLLVNCVGEYVAIPKQDFGNLLNKSLDKSAPTYTLLKSKNFIAGQDLELAIEMLSTKMRTRKAFLKDFTSLHMVVLTGHCNCRCDYCHASSSDITNKHTYQNMSPQIADAAVNMIFESPSPEIKIEFQGGEPLINWDVLVQIVHHAKELNLKAKKQLEFVLCTNMALLDEKKIIFLKKEGVLISTSLDGPKSLHDLHRKMRDGSSGYDKFTENLALARHFMGRGAASPLLTITRDHLDKLPEVIDEYIRLGFKGIFLRALNPYGFAREEMASLGYPMEDFIEAYKKAFRYILERNLQGEYFSENYATLLLSRILTPFATGFMDLQSPAGAGISGAIYDYDGGVYPTDEGRMLARTGDKEFLLGNVLENSFEEVFGGHKLRSLTSKSCVEILPGCSSCAYQTYCGADPVRYYVETGDVVGFRPESEFCMKNMAIIDFLFGYLLENDERVMDVFWSWITRKPLEAIRS